MGKADARVQNAGTCRGRDNARRLLAAPGEEWQRGLAAGAAGRRQRQVGRQRAERHAPLPAAAGGAAAVGGRSHFPDLHRCCCPPPPRAGGGESGEETSSAPPGLPPQSFGAAFRPRGPSSPHPGHRARRAGDLASNSSPPTRGRRPRSPLQPLRLLSRRPGRGHNWGLSVPAWASTPFRVRAPGAGTVVGPGTRGWAAPGARAVAQAGGGGRVI